MTILQAGYPLMLLVFAACMLIPVTLLARRSSRIPGGRALLVLFSAVTFWAATYAGELAAPSSSAAILWWRIRFLGMVWVSPAWLCFAVGYTGRKRFLTPAHLTMLCAIPLCILIIVGTNDWHGLLYSSFTTTDTGPLMIKNPVYGAGYWLFVFYTHLIMLWGTIIFLRESIHTAPVYRRQLVDILLASLVPGCCNIIFVLGLGPVPHLDFTPLAFFFTVVMLSVTVIHHHLFDLVPVAHDVIMDHMLDAVLVEDRHHRIVSANRAALRILDSQPAGIIGKSTEELRSCCPSLMERLLTVRESREELELTVAGTLHYYDLSISAVNDRHGRMTGRIVMLHNVTDRTLARQALLKSEEKFKRLSITDALTSLFNVRHFYEQMDSEIARSHRYHAPLSIMLLDIDDFKQYNDRWGHLEGDMVLVQLGKLLRDCLRVHDTAYRYGGEEFTVILPSTTIQDALLVADRIRATLAQLDFNPAPDQRRQITVSIGIAQLAPGETPRTFLARADKHMYDAKGRGKDQICVAEQPPAVAP